MPYIGNTAANRFVAPEATTRLSGNGSATAFTLEHSVGSDEDILVSVDGVVQEPSVAYAVSNGTTLTFTAAPSSNSGNNIFVYYLFRTIGTVSHPSNNALSATSGTFTGAFTSLGIDDNADATAITIDSSEHVGIGIAGPDGTLHVHSASAGSVTPQTDSDDLVVENNGHGGISILTPDANRSAIVFGHASDNLKMQIRHDGGTSLSQIISDDTLTFNVSGGTERMRIDTNGHITKPTQPTFLARPSGAQNSIANNDTIVFAEIFDRNADFSSNTFTAPIEGLYQLDVTVRAGTLDTAASYVRLFLATSNRNYESIFDISKLSGDASFWTFNISVLADMDANDTAFVKWSQSGGAAQSSIGTAEASFSGYLVA